MLPSEDSDKKSIVSNSHPGTGTDSRSIVNRHLRNINDVISEEDIRNVDPNLLPLRKIDDENSFSDDDIKEVKELPTSYNILDT